MKVSGVNTIPFPPQTVWDALLDPNVLVRTIPGCERLESTGPNSYAMTVTAGVAAIKGTYNGACTLSDLDPHQSLVMRLQGSGAPGTIDATVQVRFTQTEAGTEVGYDADAAVGGMVGGVGQRMLTSVAKRMAAEFFGNVATAISGGPLPVAAVPGLPSAGATPGVAAPGAVFTAPSRQPSRSDFAKGVAVGAGLVLLGVLAGAIAGWPR